MTWSDFYLICFAVGFLFSLLSFVAGSLNLHGHWPHVHFHSGAHAPGGNGGVHAHGATDHSVSPFNFFTIAIFLAWFGGTGYLLTRFSTVVFALGLLISTIVGLVGASIVFVFLAKVLMSPEAIMDSADYEMVGIVGRVPAQSARAARAKLFTRKWAAAAPVRREATTTSPSIVTPKWW